MRIGILADIQYSDEDNFKKCRYRDSLSKLSEAVRYFNSEKVDFVVQLGDAINRGMPSYEPVLKILESIHSPIYNVLGNHDYIVDDVEKCTIPSKLKMPSRYYSFHKSGWEFIFLDGNDLSLNAHPEDSSAFKQSQDYFDSLDGLSEWWNGAIAEKQMSWLQQRLQKAEETGRSVGLFCHFPIIPESRFTLWNADEVYQLISGYEHVHFWMNGHHHEGAYLSQSGKHYLTFKGMVESDLNAYAIMEIALDKISIDGRGEETTRVLSL